MMNTVWHTLSGLPYDQFWANTVLLLHGDGTNGSTTFTDSTGKNTITANGNAQISTAQSKFGGSSMYFDGTDDYLAIPNSPVLQFGSGNFTIEFWMYSTNLSGIHQIINTQSITSTNLSYAVITNGTSLYYYLSSTGTTWNLASGVAIGTISANTWNHVALVRNGTTITPYLNGVTGTTTSVSTTELYNFISVLNIGTALATEDYAGYIDDFRITKGVARYTGNFTVPTQAFPNF